MIKYIKESKYFKDEMKKGIEVEKEHRPTYLKIKAYLEKYNVFPPELLVYQWISQDHQDESLELKNPLYYDMLLCMEDLMKRGITSDEIKEMFIKDDLNENNKKNKND